MVSEKSDETIHDKMGVQINPLSFIEADFYFNGKNPIPTYEQMYHFLQSYGSSASIELGLARYRKLSEEIKLLASPAHQKFLSKIVWPLKAAMADYIIGNFLGTISVCGIIGEMMAIFLFEVWNEIERKTPMTKNSQKRMFGRIFEELDQVRRVGILYEYELIDEKIKPCYDKIRTKRNDYLHMYSLDINNIENDAFEVFQCTHKIIVNGLELNFPPKQITIKKSVFEYLKKTNPDYEKFEKIFSNLATKT